MTTLTPNYSLTTYAATGGDEATTFLDYRTAITGTSNSNMTKIDTALKTVSDEADKSLIVLKVLSFDEDLEVGNGAFYFPISEELNGKEITNVSAFCYTASSSGTPTIQIARGRRASSTSAATWVDTLSTRITLTAGQYYSSNGVINSTNKGVQTMDLLRIDIDVTGTGTKGLDITILLE